MIKNIVFDIGNVLASFAWEEFFQSFGIQGETFERLANATVRNPFWNEMDRGVLSDEEIIEGFIRNDPSVEPQIRQVMHDISGIVTRRDYAGEWIRELKERGYKVYVISNFSAKAHVECADALYFLEDVDGAIMSYREKLLKPSGEIFDLLCRRYGLKAEECVFLDDMPQNVEGAKKAGFSAIRFVTYEQAKEELEKMLR